MNISAAAAVRREDPSPRWIRGIREDDSGIKWVTGSRLQLGFSMFEKIMILEAEEIIRGKYDDI